MRLLLAVAAAVTLALPTTVSASDRTLRRCRHHHTHHYCRKHHFKPTPASRWRTSVASWYSDDGGPTASGWRARYGVADCGSGGGPCYPFGTRVEFCLHGCVVATVDDHGPYVAGRAWDLDEAAAGAIGLKSEGVGKVRWRRLK